MGLWGTIKGWLNIGGVKVKVQGVDTLSKKGTALAGKIVLTTGSDKRVLKVQHKVIRERSSGRGDEQETEEKVLGQSSVNEPFELKAGQSRELSFSVSYVFDQALKDQGGMLGAVGKLGAFASAEKDAYYVVVAADVEGTPFDATDKVELKLVD